MNSHAILKSWTTNTRREECTVFKFENDLYPLLDDELACDDSVIFELAAIRNQTPAE
jgi:hypothetical protein